MNQKSQEPTLEALSEKFGKTLNPSELQRAFASGRPLAFIYFKLAQSVSENKAVLRELANTYFWSRVIYGDGREVICFYDPSLRDSDVDAKSTKLRNYFEQNGVPVTASVSFKTKNREVESIEQIISELSKKSIESKTHWDDKENSYL